jgi:hypothetical protein
MGRAIELLLITRAAYCRLKQHLAAAAAALFLQHVETLLRLLLLLRCLRTAGVCCCYC